MGLFSFFTKEIAIDLGTANTVILHNNQVVVDEPSIIALDTQTKTVKAVGKQALMMEGRTPAGIIKKFQLKNPIYAPTAAYGHMGRKPYTKAVTVQGKRKIVQFFGWELLDSVPAVKKAFSL